MTDDALDKKSAFRANQTRRSEMTGRNTIGFAAKNGEYGYGQTTAYKTSTSLSWARKQGLNCEQDIMAEQLRMQCQAQLCRHLTNVWLFMIFVVLVVK